MPISRAEKLKIRAQWFSLTDAEKQAAAELMWHANSRPMNGLELRFARLVAGSYLRYVGNNKVWVNGHCPDFILKSRHKIVEVYGDYWHSKPKARRKNAKRLIDYTAAGYQTLIVWEHEILNEPAIVRKSVFAFLAQP